MPTYRYTAEVTLRGQVEIEADSQEEADAVRRKLGPSLCVGDPLFCVEAEVTHFDIERSPEVFR